jgi:uncharacterized damage-inducible protein DinB
MNAVLFIRTVFPFGLVPALMTIAVVSARAQPHEAGSAVGMRAEVTTLLSMAEEKFNAPAEAMDAEQYAWRPGEGVRSVGEVFRHVAGANFWMPVLLGCALPEGPISQDYQSVVAYEAAGNRDATPAGLRDSFTHLKQCIDDVPDSAMNREVDMFGTPGNVRTYLMMMLTHVHEHLGQSIAYARMNGVVPPWSR